MGRKTRGLTCGSWPAPPPRRAVQVQVRLDGGHAAVQRRLERRQRVLRCQAACPTVALHVEPVGRHGTTQPSRSVPVWYLPPRPSGRGETGHVEGPGERPALGGVGGFGRVPRGSDTRPGPRWPTTRPPSPRLTHQARRPAGRGQDDYTITWHEPPPPKPRPVVEPPTPRPPVPAPPTPTPPRPTADEPGPGVTAPVGAATAPAPPRTAAAPAPGEQPLHRPLKSNQSIVYVLDRSGSMGEHGQFEHSPSPADGHAPGASPGHSLPGDRLRPPTVRAGRRCRHAGRGDGHDRDGSADAARGPDAAG